MSSSISEVRRASSTEWIEAAGRIGYGAKGIVYGLVGVLALLAAFGSGGQTEGSRGAIREIGQQTFGQVLLVLIAVGLAGYAVWRLVVAIRDSENNGTDTKGIVTRVGYAVSALANAALALYAGNLAIGEASGSGSDSSGSSRQELTAQLMAQPWGQWLIGTLGAIVIGVAIVHFYRASKQSFVENYRRHEMSATELKWAKRIGSTGLAARGVTFGLIGWFLIQAAVQYDPSEAGGLGKALDTLASQPYGPWLLALVALGLICYGVFCFSYARYRDFDKQS